MIRGPSVQRSAALHRAARVNLDERETIGRKLKKVGRRNGFDLLRRRPVGLVVDDQHFIAQVDEAVDLADELQRRPLPFGVGEQRHDRHLGPALGAEQGGELRRVENRQRLARRCSCAPPATALPRAVDEAASPPGPSSVAAATAGAAAMRG